MPLEAPNLDTRTFADLVKEARDRIPRFTPDWTNLNDADPGMTLVKLQAWLTETLLYKVNQLPDLNYIKFLQLLNVEPFPANAAKTELQFRLKKLDQTTDPLSLFIPKNAQIEADDPDLESPVVFETDKTLTAINAVIAAVITTENSGADFSLVTSYDAKKAITSINHSFYPFSEAPTVLDSCLLGILLRPMRKDGVDYSQDVFPAGPLDISVSAVEVFEQDENGEVIEGPLGAQSFLPHELTDNSEGLNWEVYLGTNHTNDEFVVGSGWESLTLKPPGNETALLSKSGHVQPVIPTGIPLVSFHQLPRNDFWTNLGLKKPPTTPQELFDDLEDPDLLLADEAKNIDWEAIVPTASLEDVANNCDDIADLVSTLQSIQSGLDVTAISRQEWIDLNVGYSDPPVPEYAMAWIRVKPTNTDYRPALLNGFSLNGVSATAVQTRIEETLGTSDGRPAQEFLLAKTPVYFNPETSAPDISLDVVESGTSTTWQRVSDFFATDSDSQVYQIDIASGKIRFGDGVRGRIPIAGASVVVRHYRVGGGAEGNVGANTITKLKTSLPKIDSVTNPRAASGGRAIENLDDAKLRAPHELKTRDRAVTADDFVFLTKQTPEVPVHKAFALANRALDFSSNDNGDIVPASGAVTVVFLPMNEEQETPQPSEAQIAAVCSHLDKKRLITTELYVKGPDYISIETLQLEVWVEQNADLQRVSDDINSTLLAYFHPLYGGDDGNGWPFGGSIYLGNIYERVLDVDGVTRVINLNVALAGVISDCQDIIPIPEGHLVYLPASVVDLKVIYDQR